MVEGHIVTSNILPGYPDEARAHHWQGAGVIVLYVHADGSVYDAKVSKSTGYDLLDREAMRAFRQWHFRPEKADFITKVPCDFIYSDSAKPGT
jgi:TonB family protein